jgi:hypothetical protein
MQIEVSASEIKYEKKADDRGRVTLGSEYARETVTVAVLEVKDEDDVRTDGGRSAGNPETRLGEVRAAGVVTLAPCGVDVSGVPARQLVDAIGSETESATPTLIP